MQRAYEANSRTPPPRATSSNDHRYARPDPHHVRPAPGAAPPPGPSWYRPYYTRWYVHPYYRWVTTTYVVVGFPFTVSPWVVTWAPPPRAGWVWEAGYWSPLGFWVPGHWEPGGQAPTGYIWEAGFFDGEAWHEGFWRPEQRAGFAWVNAFFDADGVLHGGYWMPIESKPGQVWIPGWFTGTTWVDGYWVPQAEYDATDVSQWTPPEGWSDGRGSTAGSTAAAPAAEPAATEDVPLAIPVDEGQKVEPAPVEPAKSEPAKTEPGKASPSKGQK